MLLNLPCSTCVAADAAAQASSELVIFAPLGEALIAIAAVLRFFSQLGVKYVHKTSDRIVVVLDDPELSVNITSTLEDERMVVLIMDEMEGSNSLFGRALISNIVTK